MRQVQAGEVGYDLHSLGWKAFQDLCSTVVSEVLGQTIQVFLPSADGGRDGAFHGTWTREKGEALSGSFTVQCKFTNRREAALALTQLAEEIEKARRLAKKGLAKNYFLMTNCKVSGVAEENIREVFLTIDGIDHFLLFGHEWISQKIRESSRLRMLVPRVYGLGDLGQILDERAYAQARDILSALGDDLAKFVVTEAYRRSARAVLRHGFVLLLGEPAAGKSTIAASLALGALDVWGCSTLKIRHAEEFVQHWNPNEPRQFFWVDDAFGTTQYQRETVNGWNRIFAHIQAAIKKGARVLFTSRDYIYRAARQDLKVGAFPLIDESQVVINVQQLTESEKQQILYNHIKLGEQPRYFRARMKPFLPEVTRSLHFLPEIARRLGSPIFTKNLQTTRESILKFVNEPRPFLVEVVTNLDRESRAAVALVFMRGGALESPISLSEKEQKALDLLGADMAGAREALVALQGSLVSLVRARDKAVWRFKHPTIADAYATIVAEDPELLDIYMSWTSAERLMEEVTCGDVGLAGVKVVVPASRFADFAKRLAEVRVNRGLFVFLASRCSGEFLKMYLERHPEMGELLIAPSPYLNVSAEVLLLLRLHTLGLLPEEWRRRFVRHVEKEAIDTPDVSFLGDGRIRSIFKEEEIRRLVGLIRRDLVPSLSNTVKNWEWDYDPDQGDPEGWFGPLAEAVQTLKVEFENDGNAQQCLDDAEKEIERAMERLLEEYYEGEEAYPEDLGNERSRVAGRLGERSIFDDVDE